MNYAAIYEADCANGEGMRTSLFVSGCTHHCKGCFNEEAWPFSYGKQFTPQTMEYILSTLRGEGIDGLSVLGGEPFEPENLLGLYPLIWTVAGTDKSIWMYSGFTWEQLIGRNDPLTNATLFCIDVLVDGPFVEAEKDVSLRFRGSRNQRIIDVVETIESGEVVLWGE